MSCSKMVNKSIKVHMQLLHISRNASFKVVVVRVGEGGGLRGEDLKVQQFKVPRASSRGQQCKHMVKAISTVFYNPAGSFDIFCCILG